MLAENRKELRDLALALRTWQADTTDGFIDRVNDVIDVAVNRLSADVPGALEPSEERTEVLPDFDNTDWIRGWSRQLNDRLNALDDGTRTYRVDFRTASEGHASRIVVNKTEHGSVTTRFLPREFFESAEYQRLVDEAGSTLDAERRRALYRELGNLIIDEAFMITVSPGIQLFGSRQQVQGLTFDIEGFAEYDQVTLA